MPRMIVLDSNHGSLVYRKGKWAGLPRIVFKTYNQILEAPKGWKWVNDLVVDSPSGPIYLHHGKSSHPTMLSRNMAMNTVQGHFHSLFSINYWSNPLKSYWSVHSGCLIDDKSLAFAYNKTTLPRPMLGCTVILDGIPKLIPLITDKNDRWVKSI